MDDNYSGSHLPTRAIYPTKFLQYILLLTGAKFLCAFGIFITYDLLKLLHIVQFLFLVKAGSSAVLIFIQKPFSSGKRLTKRQWFRVARHAFLGTLINLLWLFALTQCGPFRSLLLFEHSDTVIIVGMSALLTSTSTPAKFRGAVFFLVAVTGILIFDHDDVMTDMKEKGEHHRTAHSGVLSHAFDHMTEMTGLSDHKGGVLLLLLALCLKVGFNTAAKKLSLDVGGAKRTYVLSGLLSSLMLLPWALFVTVTKESMVTSWFSMLIPLSVVTAAVFIVNFYADVTCSARLEAPRAHRIGAIAVFSGGLVLSTLWNHPFIAMLTTTSHLQDAFQSEHVLSGGVIFSFVLFVFSTVILTSPNKSSTRGSFIGYSSSGLPLYTFASDQLQKTSHSLLLVAKNGLKQILEESDSRKIFYFLCINMSFTFVELVYGGWTNSLSLISDGFHMLFDCSALVMGLYAAVMSRWPATRIFSYGFDRVEVLSGFINALFLVVIALFVFTAALSRIFDPQEIHTERLLAVSVTGFLVNIIGMLAFKSAHGHSHGGGGHAHGGGGHAHGGGAHGHSHGGGAHGHSHGGGGHGHSHGGGHANVEDHSNIPVTHNTNMEGVFLHVLADTLGSVGVIISTLLIENFGWTVADPVCSLFIASLIFLSVIPLVRETASVLLLRTPPELQDQLDGAVRMILATPGVAEVRNVHFWRHSSKAVCATLHVISHAEVSEQKLTAELTCILKDAGVTSISLQVEKPSFFQHIIGLDGSLNQSTLLSATPIVKLPDYKGL